MTDLTDDLPAFSTTTAPDSVHVTVENARSGRFTAWFAPDSAALTWVGIVVAGIGFVLIGIGWGQVAGETQVYLQLPYLVSAGLSGLGLIMVGVTVVNVAAKRRDALERGRQIERLVSILGEVEAAVAERREAAS